MGTITIMLLLRCGQIMNIGYEKVLLMQNDLNPRFQRRDLDLRVPRRHSGRQLFVFDGHQPI